MGPKMKTKSIMYSAVLLGYVTGNLKHYEWPFEIGAFCWGH